MFCSNLTFSATVDSISYESRERVFIENVVEGLGTSYWDRMTGTFGKYLGDPEASLFGGLRSSGSNIPPPEAMILFPSKLRARLGSLSTGVNKEIGYNYHMSNIVEAHPVSGQCMKKLYYYQVPPSMEWFPQMEHTAFLPNTMEESAALRTRRSGRSWPIRRRPGPILIPVPPDMPGRRI